MPSFERSGGADGPVVQALTDRGFSVDGGIYQALLLTPQRADEWRSPAFEALTEEALAPILALEPAPEFLVLGTGPRMRLAPRALVAALEARGIGVEAMDSRAAARTWGLLRGEGRWIVAALMPLS